MDALGHVKRGYCRKICVAPKNANKTFLARAGSVYRPSYRTSYECMSLDGGRYGLYGYRLRVTGHEEIRDDFLLSKEDRGSTNCDGTADAGKQTVPDTSYECGSARLYTGG